MEAFDRDIVLHGVGKCYAGGTAVLKDLNLRIPDKRITAIMGPSGIGKTTLLKILLGLIPFEGSISGMPGRKVSAVFQESRLLPWLTLRQNLALVCGAAGGQHITDALAWTELTDAADRKPAELSGGMQRRGALARAIAHDGDTLILDEPFTGLDEELKDRIAGRLTAHWREEERTVLFVTHDSAEAACYADVIIHLQDALARKEEESE